MNRPSVGIACDATSLAIVWRDGNSATARWRTALLPHDGSPDSVARALSDAARLAPTAANASITLARPLAHLKTIALPHMPRTTLEGVLARDWSRHVIGHRNTPHSASAVSFGDDKWLAAFAPTDLLDALADGAGTQGWSTTDVATADDALASAARALAPEQARDCLVVLCDATGPTDVVLLRNAQPWLGRHLLANSVVEDVLAFTHAASGEGAERVPVIVMGHATHTKPLASALGAQGRRATAIDLGLAAESTALELLAVAGTLGAATLPLRSSRTRERDASRMRAMTRWIAVAAGVVLLVGLGLARWKVQRDLAEVQRERADIAAPVRNAMNIRSDVENTTEVAAALADRETRVSRVSGVLAAVALALPSNATLTALRISGDSVTIEGESPRSAAVYAAMRAVPSLEQVALAAPLRQERQAGDVVIEHFAFSARIRRGATR